MSKLTLGLVCGLIFGVIDVLLMIPLSHPDKKRAMAGAFFSRFAIGLAIGTSGLPMPGWTIGLVWGVLISLPDAIITKAYIPILPVGAAGGVIVGMVVGAFGFPIK